MKRILILVLVLLLAYQHAAWQVDKQCRKYLGWEYYSLFPVAQCSLPNGINSTPYKKLKAMLENPWRFDNQKWGDWMAHY